MSKNGPTTIVLVTMDLKAVPLEALAGVVSTSTSKTFSAVTSSRRFSAGVPVDGGLGGSDILLRHSVELVDVLLGSEQEVVLDLPEICATCEGTGARGGVLETCTSCGGQGQVRVRQQVGPFIQEVLQTCSDCGGRGKIAEHPCGDCDGTGTQLKSNTIRFSVPEGAENGTRLRMRGKGEPAPQGVGEPGDLFIEIEVETHPWFERTGSDLIMSLPLGYADLLLGTTVELEHLDGKPLIIKVPLTPIRVRPSKSVNAAFHGSAAAGVAMSSSFSNSTCRKSAQGHSKSLDALRSDLSPDDVLGSIVEDASERRRS